MNMDTSIFSSICPSIIWELLKSGTGRDGMGRSRILNYGTGLDTKTYKSKPSYLLSTENIKINLRNQFLAYKVPFLDSQCSSVFGAKDLYRSCMFLEAIGLQSQLLAVRRVK